MLTGLRRDLGSRGRAIVSCLLWMPDPGNAQVVIVTAGFDLCAAMQVNESDPGIAEETFDFNAREVSDL